jgi:hypothetical protein
LILGHICQPDAYRTPPQRLGFPALPKKIFAEMEPGCRESVRIGKGDRAMNSVIYLIGLVVVVLAILSFLGIG